MRRITFYSRQAAAILQPPARAVLISIHDRSEERLTPQPGWQDVLYLRFHDTDGTLMGLEVFSAEQAKQCIEFMQTNSDCEELIVHCQLGQSRSAGVALFFAEYFNVPCYKVGTPVSAQSYRLYNRKVYGTLYECVHGVRGAAFEQLAADPEQ